MFLASCNFRACDATFNDRLAEVEKLINLSKSSLVISITSTGVTHLTVAERVFDGSSRLPSPKKDPDRKMPTSFPVLVVTSTLPEFMKYIESPLSPWRRTTWPLGKCLRRIPANTLVKSESDIAGDPFAVGASSFSSSVEAATKSSHSLPETFATSSLSATLRITVPKSSPVTKPFPSASNTSNAFLIIFAVAELLGLFLALSSISTL
mmetsp:Transcript_3436/g.5371  ORF Transcript_3436/g.5371 Transcript_3436/m.5371 type:complete len:208 (-) Transcript_3436:1546-2169(-)